MESEGSTSCKVQVLHKLFLEPSDDPLHEEILNIAHYKF